MNGLEQIAATGAPGVVTALGMGTVFLCLALLYLITRLIGIFLPGLLSPAGQGPAAEVCPPPTEDQVAAAPPRPGPAGADEEGVAAAIAIALGRHRSSRARPVVGEMKGDSPWKLAGRLRALRGS